jgi:hypothetical protein
MTRNGHRVAVYLDTRRVLGEDCGQSLELGLLHSYCFLPVMSYGSTAPLASFRVAGSGSQSEQQYWPATPLGLERLQGVEEDNEDDVLEVVLLFIIIGYNLYWFLGSSSKYSLNYSWAVKVHYRLMPLQICSILFLKPQC